MKVMRDTKDSPILATAIMEGIGVFVTGDKDFLVLDVEMPEMSQWWNFLDSIDLFNMQSSVFTGLAGPTLFSYNCIFRPSYAKYIKFNSFSNSL